jgi:HSP20 family protein
MSLANLTRWEPLGAMNDMFGRFPNLFGRLPRPYAGNETNSEWAPFVDVSENQKEYLIRAALPAVKKEDVDITVEDGMLTLSGERCQQEEQKDEKVHKIESYYGNFLRSFVLPDAVDTAAISAESKDGVLTIHIPKTRTEIKKPTTIKVQ